MELVKKLIDFVMDILETVVFIGSLFIVFYLFIAAPNQVKGGSMEPTFQNGDYILTNKIEYRLNKPQRGDVVVFASLKNPDIDYIKRIIAISGDRVLIQGSSVYVNGNIVDEPYISAKTAIFDGGFMRDGVEVTVPENMIYVMGDNRPRSSDSREFGFVPIDRVIGKVFYRYFPPNKMGEVKNPYKSENFWLLGLDTNKLSVS